MQNQKGNTSVIVSFIIVAAIIGLVIYALIYKPKPVEEEKGVVENTPTDSTKTATVEEQSTSKKSMEQTAKNGDTLVMNYTGRLSDGTVFDSNVDPKFKHVQPFAFTLGAGQVIKGWDEGLLGMKVGEKKTLTIPPEKGYGARGQGPIPPNATLIFDVELVAIQ